MREITVLEHLSLDGVMQAPGAPDEDRTGGFDRGGWAQVYNDQVLGATMAEGMREGGELLFGRRTYDQFFSFWPGRTDNPFTEVLDRTGKWVVTSRPADLPWRNSTGVGVDGLHALKEDGGPGLTVLGSGRVVAALRERDLVDRYVLVICPLLLGRGRRLFPDGPPAGLRLVRSLPTTTGAIIATYEPVR